MNGSTDEVKYAYATMSDEERGALCETIAKVSEGLQYESFSYFMFDLLNKNALR